MPTGPGSKDVLTPISLAKARAEAARKMPVKRDGLSVLYAR